MAPVVARDLAGEQARVAGVEERPEAGARAERDDEVDLSHRGEAAGRVLGEASRDDERRPGALASKAAHGAPPVAQGALRDRAAVEEDDVGPRRRVRADERRRRPARVDAAHLAAERLDEEAPLARIR